MYGKVEVQLHEFITSALYVGEMSASCPSFHTRETALMTHWIGCWMGPTANLDLVVKKNPCQELKPGSPVHSLVTTVTVSLKIYVNAIKVH